jgi:hypothetical protein
MHLSYAVACLLGNVESSRKYGLLAEKVPRIEFWLSKRGTRKEPTRTAIDCWGVRALSEWPTMQELSHLAVLYAVDHD